MFLTLCILIRAASISPSFGGACGSSFVLAPMNFPLFVRQIAAAADLSSPIAISVLRTRPFGGMIHLKILMTGESMMVGELLSCGLEEVGFDLVHCISIVRFGEPFPKCGAYQRILSFPLLRIFPSLL